MQKIYAYVKALIDYAINSSLASEYDRVFLTNRIIEALELTGYAETGEELPDCELEEILKAINDYAFENDIIAENSTTYRDLFDTKIMGLLTPAPSTVIEKFYTLAKTSKEAATDFYYSLSKNSDYIREYRVRRDVRYKHASEYGDMDITINLSKPEKTPTEIAAARNAKKSGYPLCLLCRENEGYAGTLSHPARQNNRIIPLDLAGEKWFMQYSPYVYYNEHCIVLSNEHTPMKIDRSTFKKELEFVEWLPHYFIGSNADLPIVGGSILSHDHMQGGRYTFAMAKAPIEKEFSFDDFSDIECGIVRWPMSVIRLRSENKESLIDLADRILSAWREYSDEDCFIYAETGNEPHNTITPIARFAGGKYELDLVLRNNIVTEEHPLGVFHPHAEHHCIKKENIGLIEVMGLAVLPARLKSDMAKISEFVSSGKNLRDDSELEKYGDWFDKFKGNYTFTEENVLDILYEEIGNTFARMLEDSGVYKRNEHGQKGFIRFIESIGGRAVL